MSRRVRLILILLILIGAGIAVATAVRRPVAFVPPAFVFEQTLPMDREDERARVAFVPGKDSVLFGAPRKPITSFDLATGAKRELFSEPAEGGFALSADGASAAVVMPGLKRLMTELRIYDIATGKVRKTFPDPRGGPWAWTPDGRRIVSAVSWMMFILDLERGETQNIPITGNHSDRINSLAFSPDGRLLGAGTWYGDVSLWRTDSWALLQSFDLGSGPDSRLGRNMDCHVTFSPDGTLFAAGGGSFHYEMLDVPSEGITSGALRVWRTSDYKLALSMDPGKPVISLSFSPDGSTLAFGTWTEVHVIDLGTGKETCQLEARRPTVEFGRDGRLMTLDEREGIRIWKRAPKR